MIQVIVEKSAAQGLPEGWIKKLEITSRSGRKNRRDPVCTLDSLFFSSLIKSEHFVSFHIFSYNYMFNIWKISYVILGNAWFLFLQFFIDPKSEYIFQSFKDASRYVETGNVGHYARKLKESDIEDDDSGNGKTDVSSFLLFVIVSLMESTIKWLNISVKFLTTFLCLILASSGVCGKEICR